MDIDPLPALMPCIALQVEPLAVSSFGLSQLIALGVAMLCLFISGFVSGSEMAYFSLTESQVEELDETPQGAGVRRLLSNPQRLLATILIANNLVNVTIVILCNYALGPVFSNMSAVLSFVLQTVILTFLILLFGEIIPKLYSSNHNVQFARMALPGLSFAYRALSPLARFLVKSDGLVRKVVTKQTEDISTQDLTRALEITEGTNDRDKEILEGILKFGDTTASEIMTPRVSLTDLNINFTFDQVMKVVLESGYSRLPVYEENEDNIKGILYSRDLLPYIGKTDDDFDWTTLLRAPYFVPESRMIDDLLEDFRKLKIHMAIVVDEFGGTQGVVTMEDVLEEIVGDIDDEYDDEDPTFKRLKDNTFVFEGRTPLTDFFRITGLNEEDYEEVTEDVETLAGMLLAIKGDFPKEKEPMVYKRCRFLVLDIEDHRITSVRVMVMPPDDTEA